MSLTSKKRPGADAGPLTVKVLETDRLIIRPRIGKLMLFAADSHVALGREFGRK